MKFFLTSKMSYFLFFRYVKILQSTIHKSRIYPTLTGFSVLPFISLLMPRSVYVWPQLDNEISTWFRWLRRIKRTCQSLIIIYHFSTKKLILSCKLHWSGKRKKQHHVRSGCWGVFCKKAFLKISQNSQRNTCATVSF